MSADTVPSHVFCPNGHGDDWLMRWHGSRADYLCATCQRFFNVDSFDRPRNYL